MTTVVGVLAESQPRERRVALVPVAVQGLVRAEVAVVVESGAGMAAGHDDDAYIRAGATVVSGRAALLDQATLIVGVQPLAAGPIAGLDGRHTLVGLLDPLLQPDRTRQAAESGATLYALELLPRITRAQAMDVLSSQASIAGYKAVILAAEAAPRVFPMMTTAAGTLSPAKVLVLGAGVAGLQAIATARRLGAVVDAFDVRAAAREQVESLGGRFVDIQPPEGAEGTGGYAAELTPDQQADQRRRLGDVVATRDVVICTALVPGRPAPRLIDAETVRRMGRGSVIVDLAAETGGNCELTRPDERVEEGGVLVLGPTDLASTAATHASQVLARNIVAFLTHLIAVTGDPGADEILGATLVARDGGIVNPRLGASATAVVAPPQPGVPDVTSEGTPAEVRP